MVVLTGCVVFAAAPVSSLRIPASVNRTIYRLLPGQILFDAPAREPVCLQYLSFLLVQREWEAGLKRGCEFDRGSDWHHWSRMEQRTWMAAGASPPLISVQGISPTFVRARPFRLSRGPAAPFPGETPESACPCQKEWTTFFADSVFVPPSGRDQGSFQATA